MSLKVVIYCEDKKLIPSAGSVRMPPEEYEIIDSAGSYDECLTCAISSKADIIMQITHPVFRLQDLFATFENYTELPMLLAFYAISEDTLVYAISGKNKYQNKLRQLFFGIYKSRFKNIYDYRSDYALVKACSGGAVDSRRLLFEKDEYLVDILRGVTQQEFLQYRKKLNLNLKDSGYYVYSWFLRSTKGIDYFHHSTNKDIYNLIGMLLKRECELVLNKYNSGEVFYSNLLTLHVIINDFGVIRSESTKHQKLSELIDELNYVAGCPDAKRYMSEFARTIEDVKEAYENIYQLMPYNFFCRDAALITGELIASLKKTPKPGDITSILRDISQLLTYDVNNPEIQILIQRLFLEIIKPSMDYDLFFYCFTNISSLIYQRMTKGFQLDSSFFISDQSAIQHSSIEIETGKLLTAVNYIQMNATSVSNVKNSLINKAIKYIHGNYHENISLITLSKHLNISSIYLSQLFKKELGISPIKYIIGYRIDNAKKLLKSSDDTVYNIALRVGFLEPKHFSKTFKRVTGMTPTQYKNDLSPTPR